MASNTIGKKWENKFASTWVKQLSEEIAYIPQPINMM